MINIKLESEGRFIFEHERKNEYIKKSIQTSKIEVKYLSVL